MNVMLLTAKIQPITTIRHKHTKTVKMYVAEHKNTVTQQKAKLKGKKITKTNQIYYVQ